MPQRALPLPVVGIPADARQIGPHPFHAVGDKYVRAVSDGAGALPLLIPALGADIDPAAVLATVDGLLFTGSPSNVHPDRYQGPPSDEGTWHDADRDATTLPLLRAALAAGVPVLGICRGLQELNVALGGTLHQKVQTVPGLNDHREDDGLPLAEQYAPAHAVRLSPDGALARLTGQTSLMVNSLHQQGIDRLAPGLAVEARAEDGLIEAVRVTGAPAFALAVQWHPEWRVRDNPASLALFRAFGDAVRAYAAGRTA